MGSDSKEDVNTMRCPKCEWVSITKVMEGTRHFGIMVKVMMDHFICTNPNCEVVKIYDTNAVMEAERGTVD